MRKIEANTEEGIAKLVACLLKLTPDDRWKVMAVVYSEGLMNFRGISWLLLKIIKKIKGPIGIFNFMYHLNRFSPNSLAWLQAETINHVINGEDTEDWDSVGGWNQREIDLLLSKVQFSLLEEADEQGLQESI